MKTERRHDLQTNWLSKELARWVDSVKPYAKVVGCLLTLALVVAVVTLFVRRSAARAESAAWDAYYQATEAGRPSLDELLAVAEDYRDTSVEPWARIAWADGQLLAGSRLLFHDRSMAQQYLGAAIDAYGRLKEDTANDMIRQRASYGLARANESLCKLDSAHQEYLDVGGAFAEISKARATLIDEKSSKEFYDWFAQAKPPQEVQPSDPGVPGEKPDFSVEGFDEQPATEPAPDSDPVPTSEDPPIATETEGAVPSLNGPATTDAPD